MCQQKQWRPGPASSAVLFSLRLLVILLVACPAGGAGEKTPRMFAWQGTQVLGAGCLRHNDCVSGLFCSTQKPPEEDCKTDRGWKVKTCGSCRPCRDCKCNEDAVDASCPRDRCPRSPSSIPGTLEGTFYSVLRMKSGLCFVSLDFQGGIFNQISSEASLEDLANLNATREGTFPFTNGTLGGNELPYTGEQKGSMCATALLGVKSGTYKVTKRSWPIEVEITYTEGFAKTPFPSGEHTFTQPGYGQAARVKLEIDQCPLISMTYTLPQSLRSLSKFGENITFPAAYGGDADDLTSTARDAVLGFSRTREVLGGVMKFGSSLRSALAPSNLSQVQCKYRYETSAHALGLQQFRLQLFECLPAEPDIDTGLRAGQKRKEWAEERSGMDSHARAMPSHRSLLSNEPEAKQDMDPGLQTEDWLIGGRGSQYTKSGVELFRSDRDVVDDSASGWWSNLRLKRLWEYLGKRNQSTTTKYPAPGFDFQGIHLACQVLTQRIDGVSTANGTDLRKIDLRSVINFVGPRHIAELGLDEKGFSVGIDLLFYDCTAEYYCEGFVQNYSEVRQWCKCPPGHISSSGFGPCTKCAGITCDFLWGRRSCSACPVCNVSENYVPAESGTTFCQCPLGYIGLTPRPPGMIFPGDALGPCEICPTGMAQPILGAAECTMCPVSPLMTTTTRYTQNPTWNWQKYHKTHTARMGATNMLECIDIMGFFEKVTAGNDQKIRITVTFHIPEEISHWVSNKDIVAIYKGSDNTTTCDENRTFDSCTRKKPTRQLIWAYASEKIDGTQENMISNEPGPTPVLWNTFNFFLASPGPGTFYFIYYAHNLNKIVLQIDHNTCRDYVAPGNVFSHSRTFPEDTGHAILGGGLERCPPGYKLYPSLAAGCLECPRGSYTTEYDSAECIACPVGTFGGLGGVCKTCPSGQSTLGLAASIENCLSCVDIYKRLEYTTIDGTVLVGERLIREVQGLNGCSWFQGLDQAEDNIGGGIITNTPPPSNCGNGVVEAPEECDDGNYDDFDGCSFHCKIEPSKCGDGKKIEYTPWPPYLPEFCDDGNTESGDGCSHNCTIEKHWECYIPRIPEGILKSTCQKLCGNRVINLFDGEQCDDGNYVMNDGCSQTCQVECGFQCSMRKGISSCTSVCNDGILAIDEECEMSLVDTKSACNIFTCRVLEGWSCRRILCESQVGIKQHCETICGDRLQIPGYEECDAGSPAHFQEGQDWPQPWVGGNGPDRMCNNACRINRIFQCFGEACASREVPPFTKQDTGMPLLSLLFEGREIRLHESTMMQGLQLTGEISQLEGTPIFLGKRLLLFDQAVPGPKKYSGLVLASFIRSLQDLDTASRQFRSVTCQGNEIITARHSEISLMKSSRFYQTTCTWTLDLHKDKHSQSGRALMNVTSLHLSKDESLVFEELHPATGDLKAVLSFDGPVNIGDLKLEQFDEAFDAHFDLPLALRVRFSSAATGEEFSTRESSVQPYRFIINLVSNDGRAKAISLYHISDTIVKVTTHHAPTNAWTSRPQSPLYDVFTGRRIIMHLPGYSSDLAADFVQTSKTLLFPMTTEVPGSDTVQIERFEEASSPTFYEGSFRGRCTAGADPVFANCTIFLRISGIDIEQHVSGNGCPMDFLGRKIGHIKLDSSVDKYLVPIFGTGSQVMLRYSHVAIMWLYGAAEEEISVWTSALLSLGSGTSRKPNDVLNIMWGEPGKAGFPSPNNWFSPDLVKGCILSEYEQVDLSYELLLRPFSGAIGSAVSASRVHLSLTDEVTRVLACNESTAEIHQLSKQSASCKFLIDSLFSRDPLQMQTPSLSGKLCESACKPALVSAVDSALSVCRVEWTKDWTTTSYQGMVFKQLLTIAAMKYWMSLDCKSNRHLKTCLGAASMPSFGVNAVGGSGQTLCPTYKGKQLPPNRPHPFVSDRNQSNDNTCDGCKSALDAFIREQHCCVASLEDADNLFLGIIHHPNLNIIEADLRDRADPFDLSDSKDVSIFFLSAAGNLTTQAENPTCHGLYLPSSCVQRYFCHSFNWPSSCCDDFRCTNGKKLYPGSCTCVCPEGYSGSACDGTGVFLSFEIAFPDETLETFDVGKLHRYISSLSDTLSVKYSDIEWEDPVEAFARRKESAGVRNLLRSTVRVKIRVKQPSFEEIDRVRLASIAAMCKPDFQYTVDFTCDDGPRIFYNASRLSAKTEKTKPTLTTAITTPPPEVISTFRVNSFALTISLIFIALSMIVAIVASRILQETEAWEKRRQGLMGWSEFCCLIVCFKRITPRQPHFAEKYLSDLDPGMGENVGRKVDNVNFGQSKFAARIQSIKEENERNQLEGGVTLIIKDKSMDQAAQDDSSKTLQMSADDNVTPTQFKDLPFLLSQQRQSKKKELLQQLNEQIRKKQEERSEKSTDLPESDEKKQDAEKAPTLVSPMQSQAQVRRARGVFQAPVEFSTKTKLRWVGKQIQSDKSVLSLLTPRTNASNECSFQTNQFPSPRESISATVDTPRNKESRNSDSPRTLEIQFNFVPDLERARRALTPPLTSELGFTPRSGTTPYGYAESSHTFSTPPPLTAELGFTPRSGRSTAAITPYGYAESSHTFSTPPPLTAELGFEPSTTRSGEYFTPLQVSPRPCGTPRSMKGILSSLKHPTTPRTGLRLGSVYRTNDDSTAFEIMERLSKLEIPEQDDANFVESQCSRDLSPFDFRAQTSTAGSNVRKALHKSSSLLGSLQPGT